MRILHVVPSYYPAVRYGGPIWSVHGLARHQAVLGHRVEVFTTNADGPGDLDVPVDVPVDIDGVAVRYFAVGQPRRLFRAPGLARALRREAGGFDVVHLHSVFLWPTLVAARAARRAGVPFVLSPRGMLVGELIRSRSSIVKRAWLALFERRTIREAAAIHVTAAREADDFDALGLTARRIVCLPNGVDPPPPAPPRFAPDIEAATVRPYALFLGRLNWKKNLVALIGAMAAVPGLRLVLAGNDDEGHVAALVDAARAHGMTDRLAIVARNVDGDDKEALFARACLFVLPSLNENFGNAALEAMVRGLPVVASEGTGIAAVVRGAGAGSTCLPTSAGLAEALGAIAADPERAAAMGAAGKAAALADYGWTPIAARMVAAYREAGASG